ncbi:MAG TPA: hypothetical protein VF085_02870 [Solirubrobacterales bacterium]
MSDVPGLDLDKEADALIAAYQATFKRLDGLADPVAVLGRHAIALSCEKASKETRRLHSEAIAKRFDEYRSSFDDQFATATNLGKKQALKLARSAVYGTSLGVIWGKILTVLAVMGALAAWLVSIGGELSQTGGGLRLLFILGGYLVGGNWIRDWTRSAAEAGGTIDPLKSLLAETLDKPEAEYFRKLGSFVKPPNRVSIAVAGPAAELGVTLVWVTIGLCILAVIYGAGLAIFGPAVEAQENAFHQDEHSYESGYESGIEP